MEEKFASVYKSIRLGLVRLTSEMVITDKNSMADILFPFPSRKGRLDVCFKKENAVSELMLLEKDGVSRISLAIREKSGTVLLLLHPELSSHLSLLNDKTLSKLVSLYSCDILEILESVVSKRKVNFIPYTFTENITDSRATVSDAVNKVLGRLSQTVLCDELDVFVDNRLKTAIGEISQISLQRAVSELLTVRELFGEKKKAQINLIAEQNHLVFNLEDNVSITNPHFARIFEETVRLMGLGCVLKISEDGRLTAKILIPIYHSTPNRQFVCAQV
jgi:hypothetical protein